MSKRIIERRSGLASQLRRGARTKRSISRESTPRASSALNCASLARATMRASMSVPRMRTVAVGMRLPGRPSPACTPRPRRSSRRSRRGRAGTSQLGQDLRLHRCHCSGLRHSCETLIVIAVEQLLELGRVAPQRGSESVNRCVPRRSKNARRRRSICGRLYWVRSMPQSWRRPAQNSGSRRARPRSQPPPPRRSRRAARSRRGPRRPGHLDDGARHAVDGARLLGLGQDAAAVAAHLLGAAQAVVAHPGHHDEQQCARGRRAAASSMIRSARGRSPPTSGSSLSRVSPSAERRMCLPPGASRAAAGSRRSPPAASRTLSGCADPGGRPETR